MARWIDTHCHVYDETTPGGTDGSLAAARDASVAAMIVIGTDADTSQMAIDIASRHGDVWATVGLHPHDASRGFDTIDHLIDAELCGVESCGIFPALQYANEYCRGYLKSNAEPSLDGTLAPKLYLDGHGGIGITGMSLAVQAGIDAGKLDI